MDEPKRPATPESGVPLEKECNIQHRSDLLMEYHIENVKKTQEALKNALIGLENAKKKDEIEELRVKVHELQKKSELQMTTLQVMHKLNTELSYARADLDEALYNGNGDINTARKRVIWLEDRMGALCGKKRLKSRPSVPQLAIQYHAADAVEDAKEDVLLFPKDEKSFTETSFITTDSEECPDDRQVKTVTTLEKLERQEEEEAHVEEKEEKVDKSEEEEKNEEDKENRFDGEVHVKGVDRGSLESWEVESSKTSTTTTASSSSYSEDEIIGRGPRSQRLAVDKKIDDVFLTEVAETPRSKVTIQTPGTLDRGQTITEMEKDLAAEYWESEHHRFERSDFSLVLCEIDPASYHCVPISVPGCFINTEQSCPEFRELPWKSDVKDTEIKDIHRIALDKLALKVHSMYDKVYSAAMLSVRPSRRPEDIPRESSFFTSRENEISTVDEKDSVTPPSADDGKSSNVVALPKIQQRRKGKPGSRHLVYYPKPIPPPEVLPITRTNKSHEYPKYASCFGDPDAAQLEPAERIVDQRNLLEETKLVLYREKKKPKKNVLSTNERRFRRMIEREKTTSSKASSTEDLFKEEENTKETMLKKLKKTFQLAKSIAQLKGGVSGWPQIKPQTKGSEFSGLRWERVKEIVHSNLMSNNVEERKDAAKQLGVLRCGDTMVFYALKQRLINDDDTRVRYECAKSLILLGCWEEEVLQIILKFLLIGNAEIRSDLIQTMMNGKNVQYVNKSLSVFVDLVKILSHFCLNPDPDDMTSFEAAVLLGKLCVADANAKKKLKESLEQNKDTHIKSRALEVLVKQLNCTDAVVVHHVQDLLRTSPSWKHRELAARLLISLGPGHPCVVEDYETIYSLLERKLWDDPNSDVRIASAKALTALGMFTRACELTEKKLEDPDEATRAQAAIAVGTLGMRSEKLTRLLLEMLELDSSEYVRLMIVRAFAALKLADKRVIRTLREREKLEGPLARESRKTLQVLELSQASSTPKTWTPKTITPSSRGTKIPA